VPERHATDVVTAVVFDYRGFDTMGEEFILFAAAAGTALLMRQTRGGSRGTDPSPASDSLRVLAAPLAGALVVLGVYVAVHGYVTPGGGFQGGVVLAAAPVTVFLAGGAAAYRRLIVGRAIDLVEGIALAVFVAVGLAGLAAGGGFLHDLLPLGKPGTIGSAGTIAVLNDITALAVGAGFLLFFAEFLEEIAPGRGR